MAEIFFFLTAIVAVGGAIGVVTLHNPFYSVLALVCHLLALAGLFLLLRAEFVAFAQVIVYAGAVMVLYVFVVGYIGGTGEQVHAFDGRPQRAVAVLFAGAVFVELSIAVLGSGLKALGEEGASYEAGFGSPAQIGELLLTRFLFAFEAASVLLLIAAVGAVVLARRRGGIHDAPQRIAVTDFLRPAGTGTMAEAVGAPDGRPNPLVAPRRDHRTPEELGMGSRGGED
ncbi:MAG TPA: NADH-quinone oxidoreductase subunit J [Capillimicrobium sp.]|nr:NADH-quinone oxidoreductase subunit J [Capillimicrobium sp.]